MHPAIGPAAISVVLAFGAAAVPGAEPAKQHPITISAVVDVRPTTPPTPPIVTGTGLAVSIGIDPEGPPVFLRRVAVDRANADDGTSVLRGVPQSIRTMATVMPMLVTGQQPRDSLTAFVYLEHIPRAARALKLVEGSIELFKPSDATRSIVRIERFRFRLGEMLRSPILEQNGIEITYLTPEQYEQRRVTIPGEDTRMGYGRENLLYVRDPDSRMLYFQVQDTAGKPVSIRTSSGRFDDQRGMIVEFARGTAGPDIPADAQLVLYVATPESLTTVPFHFEDIELP